MVIVEQCADGTAARIQARGNFSLGAGGLLILLATLATITLGLAGILAWQGYWPVLTIAVVQLALVFWALLHAWRRAWIVEEIVIDEKQVRVRRRRYRSVREFRLESAWAWVRLVPPPYRGYAPRLILRSMDQQLELGTYLTIDEKTSLAQHLSRTLATLNAWH